MKKLTKLQIRKVTLKNLDEPQLDVVAGAITGTCLNTICIGSTCVDHITCVGYKTCVVCS